MTKKAASTSTRKPSTRKPSRKPKLAQNMTTEVQMDLPEVDTGVVGIEDLLAAEFADLEKELGVEPEAEQITIVDDLPEAAIAEVEMAPVEAQGSLDDLELLKDLESDPAPEEVVAIAEVEMAAAIAEIEMEEVKAEAYAEQESESDIISTEPVESTAGEKVVEAREPRKTMTGHRKSEVVKDKLGAKLGEVVILEVTDAMLPPAVLKERQDELLANIDKMAKKVGEKAVNLLSHINGTAKLSAYTDIAIAYLAKHGSMTTNDLISHLTSGDHSYRKPYSIGTARSQTHQMFALLPQFKIGVMEGKTMKVNPNSVIFAHLAEKPAS
ncbi:hypothetical protein [Ectothiorhodospira shaposhnikovii]|uniref:hypothetical protein n=1 Tax=Ectothiorhodospira shaposhnikovii TaxID=1054 RepID=UPI001EE8D5E2|nr:hypothetical protein [Ectothiorhodospira shaposhnikovii]MCG5512803.1 hypothetical protein [Ectothiorhodospira shaposhnikovii]